MDPEPRRGRPAWLIGAFGLTLLGAACAGYLLRQHLAGPAGAGNGCKLLGYDCSAAINSSWGTFLGIPLGGWGLVHFSVVLALLLLVVGIGTDFHIEGSVGAALAAAVAAIAGVVLTMMMLTGRAPLCPLCLAVHGTNLLLMPVVVLASGATPRVLAAALVQGLRCVFHRSDPPTPLLRWKVTGFFMATFIGIIAYQWVQIQVDRAAANQGKRTLDQALTDFDSSPLHDLPLADGAPRVGPADARICLTVFCDFECPYCRKFALTLRHLRLDHPEVAFLFRHFPLSSACNPATETDLHPHACRAALAAEAAQRQGRFREFHEAACAAAGMLDDAQLQAVAIGVGLDLRRFNIDRSGDEAKARLDADVELAAKLQVDGTPTVYLNGRLVSTTGMPWLREIVERELAR